jgi:catechol 2,3-dioxygenase-like lactoylglutathione lyase family enzyme
VNHVAFGVPDIRAAVDRTKKAGYPMVTREELPDRFDVVADLGFIPQLDTSVAFTIGPDDIKVEFLEVRDAREAIAFHHVHFFCPDPEQMKMWYAAAFGVAVADRGPFQAIDLPGGLNLTFSQSGAVVPTSGRVLDRIGFELSDGAAWSGHVLTDPWGTTIEISEPR